MGRSGDGKRNILRGCPKKKKNIASLTLYVRRYVVNLRRTVTMPRERRPLKSEYVTGIRDTRVHWKSSEKRSCDITGRTAGHKSTTYRQIDYLSTRWSYVPYEYSSFYGAECRFSVLSGSPTYVTSVYGVSRSLVDTTLSGLLDLLRRKYFWPPIV